MIPDKFIDHITRYNTEKNVYDMLYDKLFPKFIKMIGLGLLVVSGDTSTASVSKRLQSCQETTGDKLHSLIIQEEPLHNHPDIIVNGQRIPYNWRGDPMDNDNNMVVD